MNKDKNRFKKSQNVVYRNCLRYLDLRNVIARVNFRFGEREEKDRALWIIRTELRKELGVSVFNEEENLIRWK